ncbi:hypothetical protein EES37_25955 [Streptomyces sp. ADI91-18]|nr:hypothetical protein EES37_25955 [Streptomyces sp. ADI91-18]
MIVPVSRVVVVKHAAPLAFSGTVVLSPAPVKVMVPVGVPLPGSTAVALAHTVTVSPHTEGSGSTDTVVMLAAWLTVTSTVPVEPVKHVSPL